MVTISVNVDDGVYETFSRIAAEEKTGKKRLGGYVHA